MLFPLLASPHHPSPKEGKSNHPDLEKKKKALQQFAVTLQLGQNKSQLSPMKNSAPPISALHHHHGPLDNFSLVKRIPLKNVQGEKKINSLCTVWQVTTVTENSKVNPGKCRK